MTYLGDCHACQWGDHSGHDPHPQIPPKGMIGGWSCPCTGDCAGRSRRPEPVVTVEQPDDGEWERIADLMRDQGLRP